MPNVKGSWRAKAFGGSPMSSPLKQGTGWNPIHAQYGDRFGNDPGRSMTPIHGLQDEGYAGAPDTALTPYDDYGYSSEDLTWQGDPTWGYGPKTGLSDRPHYGEDHDMTAGQDQNNYPSWGPESGGFLPGGTVVRSYDHGGGIFDTPDANDAKVVPEDDVAQGWVNKETSYVEDAETSDPSQYEMQTSMTQRDKVKAGSQVPSGRANEFDAPIQSRHRAMKKKVWAASPELPGHAQRHDDMFPKQQDLILRPWWTRTAGTGAVEWMHPNELYVSEPMQRVPPDNPNQGSEVTQSGTVDDSYGYSDEDMGLY